MPDVLSAVVEPVTAMPRPPGTPRTPTGGANDGGRRADAPTTPSLWRPLFLPFGPDLFSERNGNDNQDADDDDDDDEVDSSPSSASATSSPNNSDPVAEGSKEVLMDRLQDVVRHLASYVPVGVAGSSSSPQQRVRGHHRHRHDDRVLGVLHARVDEIEAVLAAAEADAVAVHPILSSPFRHDRTRSSLSSLGTVAAAAAAIEPGSPLGSLRHRMAVLARSPSSILTGRPTSSSGPPASSSSHPAATAEGGAVLSLWDLPLSPPRKKKDKKTKSNDGKTHRALAIESARLADELAAALARLTMTSREAEDIQQALFDQLTASRHREAILKAEIVALTRATPTTPKDTSRDTSHSTGSMPASATVSTMASTTTATSSHLETMDAELSFLRLQLRAIELRCRTYVPDDVDPELAESIANWKAEWAALRAQVDEEEQAASSRNNTTGQW